MTREQAEARKDALEEQVEKLENQLLAADTASATLSAGGGSKSYTNRSVVEIKAKIKYAKHEIAVIEARLGLRANPNKIIHVLPRYFR